MSEFTRGLLADDPDSDPEADLDSEAELAPEALDDSNEAVDDSRETPDEGGRRRRGLKKFRRRRGPKKRRRLSLAVLPTMLTLGNGICGLAAIAIAMNNTLDWPEEQKLFAAGILIFAGMLFDALDGSAARITGQASQFGAELDSLCDAITFGTAPAVIVWQISDALPQRLTWGIGVLFTLCVLIRLARFNVETTEDDTHEGFEGLPSPAAAGTLAAFSIAIPDIAEIATDELYPSFVQIAAGYVLEASHYVIPILALVLAYLMVSRFHYPHIVQQWVGGRRPPHKIGQAMFAVIGVFLLHWIALPLAFSYFAFGTPLRSWWRRRGSAAAPAEPQSTDLPA